MAGLGSKDEIAAIRATTDNATGLLAVAEPKCFDVAFELGDSLAVRGGVVGRPKQTGLLPFNDEAVVNGVGATGSAHRDFGMRHEFDARAPRDLNQVRFDRIAEWLFQQAILRGVFEDRSKLASLVYGVRHGCSLVRESALLKTVFVGTLVPEIKMGRTYLRPFTGT